MAVGPIKRVVCFKKSELATHVKGNKIYTPSCHTKNTDGLEKVICRYLLE